MASEADKPDFSGPLEYKTPSDFAGQLLFIQGDDWHNNAMLGWTHFPLDTYALGYKDAADALLYALAERRTSLDTVIYPLVFLYRQALELELKLLLPLARRLADAPAKDDHRQELMPMWKELRQHLEVLITDRDDAEHAAMEEFIGQLHEADPRSFAFRYPTNMKGEVSLPDLTHVNVRHLREVMDSIFLMLNGIHSMLGEMGQHDQHAEW